MNHYCKPTIIHDDDDDNHTDAVVGFFMVKVISSWTRSTRVRVVQTKVARLPKAELQNVTDLEDIAM